jgi:hypothetical protein
MSMSVFPVLLRELAARMIKGHCRAKMVPEIQLLERIVAQRLERIVL